MQQSVRRLPDLQKLQERLRLASPDLSEVRRDTREIYSGAKDQENQAKIASEIQRFERLLDSADVKSHPLSLEFVRTELGSLRLQSSVFGVAVDAARLLADARAAYDQHQDSATLDALINAHFFKAHEELRSQNPDYAQAAEQSRRALSGKLLIAALLERGHALSPAIRQNAQLLQAMELLKEHRRRFPNFRSASEWALLQPIAPTEAASLGRQLQSDQAGRLSGQIEYQLNPLSASAVLEQYWTHKLNGDPKRALEIYETARQDGVPLPPL